jgi:hypothetical protein
LSLFGPYYAGILPLIEAKKRKRRCGLDISFVVDNYIATSHGFIIIIFFFIGKNQYIESARGATHVHRKYIKRTHKTSF